MLGHCQTAFRFGGARLRETSDMSHALGVRPARAAAVSTPLRSGCGRLTSSGASGTPDGSS